MRSASRAVILEGGMGNQLFQYAFGLNSGDRPVVLDNRRRAIWGEPLTRALRPGAWRPPSQVELLRARQCPRVRHGQRTLIKAWARAFGQWSQSRVIQEGRATGEVMPDRGRGVRLCEGYFQDERYLLPVKEEFLAGLVPDLLRPHPDTARAGDHLAISLRLGPDYQHFGLVLPDAYYLRAIRRLIAGVDRPVLHVCADDAEATRRLLSGASGACDIVEHLGESPIDQLRVLASVRRVAIANSSFAWWGAWLGDMLQGAGRLVLCPDRWLAGPETIAPARWTRICATPGEVAAEPAR